jgi:hypothetical protein
MAGGGATVHKKDQQEAGKRHFPVSLFVPPLHVNFFFSSRPVHFRFRGIINQRGSKLHVGTVLRSPGARMESGEEKLKIVALASY